MRAILYENGVEKRRVADFTKITTEIKLIPMPVGWEWKLIFEEQQPAFNQYLERLDRSEVDNDEQHPDYTDFKMIRLVWNVVRKSDAEITELLKEREDNANRNLVDKIKYLALYMGIVNRKVDGGNITAKMQTLLDDVDTRLVKLWQNDSNLDSKLTELSQGGDPDPNTGWTNE